MKARVLLILLVFPLLFVACMDESEDPMIPDPMDQMDNPSDGMTLYMGDFVSDAHPTSGKASADLEEGLLTFSDFMTDNGPLLEVYMATDTKASEFISLGELQGIKGDFDYDLPEELDLDKYSYVLIWCVEFSVNFGYAKVEK